MFNVMRNINFIFFQEFYNLPSNIFILILEEIQKTLHYNITLYINIYKIKHYIHSFHLVSSTKTLLNQNLPINFPQTVFINLKNWPA